MNEKLQTSENMIFGPTQAEIIAMPRKLLQEAHAVMREAGWHLATEHQRSDDGVIEAAASEIEERFAELLAPPTTGEQP